MPPICPHSYKMKLLNITHYASNNDSFIAQHINDLERRLYCSLVQNPQPGSIMAAVGQDECPGVIRLNFNAGQFSIVCGPNNSAEISLVGGGGSPFPLVGNNGQTVIIDNAGMPTLSSLTLIGTSIDNPTINNLIINSLSSPIDLNINGVNKISVQSTLVNINSNILPNIDGVYDLGFWDGTPNSRRYNIIYANTRLLVSAQDGSRRHFIENNRFYIDNSSGFCEIALDINGLSTLSANPSGLRLFTSGTRPPANITYRNTLYITQGAAGVADKFEICLKDSSNNYAWYPIVSVP